MSYFACQGSNIVKVSDKRRIQYYAIWAANAAEPQEFQIVDFKDKVYVDFPTSQAINVNPFETGKTYWSFGYYTRRNVDETQRANEDGQFINTFQLWMLRNTTVQQLPPYGQTKTRPGVDFLWFYGEVAPTERFIGLLDENKVMIAKFICPNEMSN